MAVKASILLVLLLFMKDRIRKSVVTKVADKQYDFIIVGGGTTGVALAGRLSEDPNLKILVLEAGKSDDTYPSTKVPGYGSLLNVAEANWDRETVPQRFSGQARINKVERWPSGKVLGGTSSMNAMIYHRGSPHDFDSWEDHGAIGWSWKDVESYFMKAEGAQDSDLSSKLGRAGPLKLSKAYTPKEMNDIFRQAAEEIGINSTDYIEHLEGFSDIVATKHHGIRVNSVEAYLSDHFPERKERLHILTEAYVTKILFDESPTPVAIGVEYEKDGMKHEVFASKEVIISAGTVATPKLLMLSGIGPEEHLKEVNAYRFRGRNFRQTKKEKCIYIRGGLKGWPRQPIEKYEISLVANVPGVGSNLKDHLRFYYHLYSDKFPELESGSPYQYARNGEGPMASSCLTALIHYRTKLSGTPFSPSTQSRPFPEIQIGIYPVRTRISDFSATNYNAKTYNSLDFIGEVGKALTQRNGTISNAIVVVGLQQSKSSGNITLKSNDPFEPPLIDPRFLSNPDDVDVCVEGLKLVEQLLDSDTMRTLNVEHVFQPYCKEHGDQRPRSLEYLRCWLRQTAVSEYHPCCTAKMGKDSDPTAVLDERLRVRGVKHLRVADASVMPHPISGNPQGTCYMVAEKAADMIKEDMSND